MLSQNGARRVPRGALVLICALLATAGIATAGLVLAKPRVQQVAGEVLDAPVQTLDDGDLRYTFHAVTGMEAIFDLQSDPECRENIAAERPDDVDRLRLLLLERLGIGSLDVLRARHAGQTAQLRALGYL